MDFGGIEWEFKYPSPANPGDTVDVYINIASPEVRQYLREHMRLGSKFEIREGARIRAAGEVTAVLSERGV